MLVFVVEVDFAIKNSSHHKVGAYASIIKLVDVSYFDYYKLFETQYCTLDFSVFFKL